MIERSDSVQPPPGSVHIVTVQIELYRAPDGTIHYVQNASVRGNDPSGEDANIRRALLVIADDFRPLPRVRRNGATWEVVPDTTEDV